MPGVGFLSHTVTDKRNQIQRNLFNTHIRLLSSPLKRVKKMKTDMRFSHQFITFLMNKHRIPLLSWPTNIWWPSISISFTLSIVTYITFFVNPSANSKNVIKPFGVSIVTKRFFLFAVLTHVDPGLRVILMDLHLIIRITNFYSNFNINRVALTTTESFKINNLPADGGVFEWSSKWMVGVRCLLPCCCRCALRCCTVRLRILECVVLPEREPNGSTYQPNTLTEWPGPGLGEAILLWGTIKPFTLVLP